jgi:hypothetical protein
VTDTHRSREHELLVVFRSLDKARQAEHDLEQAGVPRQIIDVDREADRITALHAEMREELAESWIMPQAGLALTKEGARGFVLVAAVCAAVAAVIAVPFAFIDFGLSFWGRLLLLVGIGIAFGGTVGLVAGPALASKRPEEPAAADRGTVLHVADDTPEIRAILARLEPIRVDEVAHGTLPRGTVTTESPPAVEATVDELRSGVDSDDYRRPS